MWASGVGNCVGLLDGACVVGAVVGSRVVEEFGRVRPAAVGFTVGADVGRGVGDAVDGEIVGWAVVGAVVNAEISASVHNWQGTLCNGQPTQS